MRFLVEACRVGCYSAFLCFLAFWNFVMELGIQGSCGVGGTLISDQQQVCWVYSYLFSKFSFFLRFNQNRMCTAKRTPKRALQSSWIYGWGGWWLNVIQIDHQRELLTIFQLWRLGTWSLRIMFGFQYATETLDADFLCQVVCLNIWDWILYAYICLPPSRELKKWMAKS